MTWHKIVQTAFETDKKIFETVQGWKTNDSEFGTINRTWAIFRK